MLEPFDDGYKVTDRMVRHSDAEVDEIVGKRFKVLDKGFIALVDYMGGDGAIVQAARVSYGKGTRTVNDDTGLIRYLMRHRHTTPFEMVELKFLARMPIYVARQWVRHRTASINEYSARYSEMPDRFELPELDKVQAQSSSNRQGRFGVLDENVAKEFRDDVESMSKNAYGSYQKALNSNIARETARILLPLNAYTEWYWKIDLHNLFHFLSLRMDPHAQWEIRQYANAMAEITRKVVPIAYQAFEDYVLNGTSLSRLEQKAVSLIIKGEEPEAAAQKAGMRLFKVDGTRMKTGEAIEFLAKLDRLKEMGEL